MFNSVKRCRDFFAPLIKSLPLVPSGKRSFLIPDNVVKASGLQDCRGIIRTPDMIIYHNRLHHYVISFLTALNGLRKVFPRA